MPTTFRLPKDEPLLNITSYGRGSPGAPNRLTPAQVEQIRRTVRRTPEAVVKVLPRSSNDLKAAGKHLDYVGRHGELELEGDDGQRLRGRISKEIMEDWDLDIDDIRRHVDLTGQRGRSPPKLIHKLMFSMPPGTPPNKVLGAVRNFAREQFALQHRYAFVLHTDEAHPHVHLVLKAVSEQGIRLNIKKVTLRHWRSEFARHLRDLGVAANATERAVRGESQSAKKDGIYRASLRGDSSYVRTRVEAIAKELRGGGIRAETGKRVLLQTRSEVMQGWIGVADRLARSGERELAADVRNFVDAMTRPKTDKELTARDLLVSARGRKQEPRTITSSVR